jgi:hypothetical protein
LPNGRRCVKADAEELARRQSECGLTAAEQARDVASDAEAMAVDTLVEARPTTVSGVLARLSYVFETFDRDVLVFDQPEVIEALLKSTFDALKQLQTS